MSELGEIRDRLTTLETQSEERWSAHDKNSKFIWHTIDEKLDLLLKHKDLQETRRSDCMKEAKEYTGKVVSLVLGIPSTILVIISIIWIIIRMTNG